MKKNILLISLIFLIYSPDLFGQISARLLQYPDVSKTKIVFSYGGDIWVAPKEGGTAVKLSSPKGREVFPKFSPDGKTIAFSGDYDGNIDVFTIPVKGGLPTRITSHPMTDRILDWTPDGKSLLFVSSSQSGRQRFDQIYEVSDRGGLPHKLPVAYGEFGEISPNGNFLAFTPRTRLFRTWKRYRGGMATDIWLYNFKDGTAKDITNSVANDELPMWYGNNTIYFLSDNGRHERFNIWVYSLKTKKKRQVTFFKNFDVHFPSIGPEDIVFENGGNLYLLSLKNEKYHKVNINVVTDEITLMPHTEKVSKYITGATISPKGNRVVFDARGDLFSIPAKHGVIVNLTKSPGVYERFPSWSPNGKYIAYWSDRRGEYQLTIKNIQKPNSEKSLTSFKTGFKYNLYWSPDSKKLAFIDNTMRIRIYDIDKNKTILVDKGLWMYNGSLENFSVSWSSDSRWIAYSRGLGNRHDAIFLYNLPENKKYQVTSGFYNNDNPVFDPAGKYLYFLTQQTFKPIYSSMQNTFIYTNATKIAAVSLRNNIPSILAPRNDEVKIKKKEKKPEKKKGSKKDEKKKDEKKIENLKIDINNFQVRMVLLPIKAGRYGDLSAVKGKLIFHQYPNSGSGSNEKPVKYYDVKERKVKTIINNADFYQLTENGKKMLVGKSKNFAIINVAPKQKMTKFLQVSQLQMVIHPRAEWKQIFNDVWRFYRDYFYDPNMHGVNWNEMKNRYGKLLNYAITRWDVNYIIGQFIGELSSSHTYRFGGDLQRGKHENVGLLGVNWELSNGAYRIKKIIHAANWDDNARSPLDAPNIKVKAGDYILSVNGIKLDPTKDPYSAFQGLADKTVELTVNNKPNYNGAWKVIVKTLRSETRLRNLSWINQKREMVDKATDGKIGYIYVPNTGINGQNELVRQFLAQINKKGLIIDERFNSGGQIPDRFIEMLNRKPIAYFAVRDGENWKWPPDANFGPKVMLINGWSGSGGDAFPDFFRRLKVGKLIGTRTWGGLIGYTGTPRLIDGGIVTIPSFRMYYQNGTWFKEGHGVAPNIKVVNNPAELAKGIDQQLQSAIKLVMKELKTTPAPPKQPPYQKR